MSKSTPFVINPFNKEDEITYKKVHRTIICTYFVYGKRIVVKKSLTDFCQDGKKCSKGLICHCRHNIDEFLYFCERDQF